MNSYNYVIFLCYIIIIFCTVMNRKKMIGYLLKLKFRTFLYSTFLLVIIIVVINQYKWYQYSNTFSDNYKGKTYPILLWWTQLLNTDLFRKLHCGHYTCLLTQNRQYFNTSNITAFLFYGSNFSPYDLPLPRKKEHIWAIIHEESPKNLASFLFEDTQTLFNVTSTFSRYSNFPITLQYLPNLEILTDAKYFLATKEKNTRLKSLAPLLYIQSDCMTPVERDSYVVELMKYIRIDSYGTCLNNKKLPDKFTVNPLGNLYSDDFLQFVSQYKFTISFENAVCYDYITEKLWRPLIAGSIPIYIGSPNVEDWLPNNNSVILASNFDSPKSLAEYIIKLNSDDKLYESYLQHKLSKTIENKLLIKAMTDRQWSIDSNGTHFFEAYECFVCENIHKHTNFGNANRKHYDCPYPMSPLTRRRNESNWWWDHWRDGKCEAHVLRKFVEDATMKNFTKEMFTNETTRLRLINMC